MGGDWRSAGVQNQDFGFGRAYDLYMAPVIDDSTDRFRAKREQVKGLGDFEMKVNARSWPPLSDVCVFSRQRTVWGFVFSAAASDDMCTALRCGRTEALIRTDESERARETARERERERE